MPRSTTGVDFRIPSSIDNLSKESIKEIISSLDTKDIISLSLTNRRFNELGMRIVLRRIFPDAYPNRLCFGLGPPSFPFSSVRYLRLAVYNKAMPTSLHAAFSGDVNTHWQMSEVHRYLQTFRCMPGSVSLDTLGYPAGHNEDTYFAFLDICAELRRVQCHSLSLGIIPTPSSPSENYRTRLMQNVLTSLNDSICKNSLACPVLREWTAASLNQSPLVSLSLYGDTASMIFPLLALPHLQVLELLGVSGSARDLRVFLNRHPHLITLHLHCEPQEEKENATALPPLKTLSSLNALLCSPAWVPFILASPDIVPVMTRFSIITFANRKLDVVKYHDLLRLVSQYKTISTLTFPLALLNTTRAWLQIPGPRAESVLQNVRTLYCFEECDSVSTNLAAAIGLFPSVQTVGLNIVDPDDFDEDDQQALADDLVDRCKNLHCLKLRLSGGPVYEVRMNEDGVRRYVYRIWPFVNS
ncbi:hypothetical protein CPB85DRAFT_439295 [Mucidula mucida]|nr:hypothetical protein CPB85DRAFT_439295 [Mucidula mucida]